MIDAMFRNPRSCSQIPFAPACVRELEGPFQAHNPETRGAWERARAQVAPLVVARSELDPTLAAAALSQTSRFEILVGPQFVREITQSFEGTLDLHYLVFDFGGRPGRIDATADALASDFAFNDTHHRIIFQVERTYYRLLNASGQEDAARASLTKRTGSPKRNRAGSLRVAGRTFSLA